MLWHPCPIIFAKVANSAETSITPQPLFCPAIAKKRAVAGNVENHRGKLVKLPR